MKKTLAIIGAGPGLGAALARQFGASGFSIALLARNRTRLAALAADLQKQGIDAREYAADVLDGAALSAALTQANSDLGGIDVLEFSPMPQVALASPTEVRADNVLPILQQQVLGAVTAVNTVLPLMRKRGRGALLFTTGASSMIPFAMMGNVGIAMAGLRNYALTLHQALAGEGIYAGHVAIDAIIQPGAGEADPDAIARRYYELCESRDRAEIKIGNFIATVTAGARPG
ncbi:MAG: SDR family NAD(P)-dependent oxidoreductase [Steroidobacteraceae bacterium]